MEYIEQTERIDVPKNSGVDGFLLALRRILSLRHVVHVSISDKGRVEYRRFVPKESESQAIDIEFDDVSPYFIIRNSEVEELSDTGPNGAVASYLMFRKARIDGLVPIAFATGANTWLWNWFAATTGSKLDTPKDTFFGLELLTDRHIPDEALIMCAGFERDARMVDTRKCYKISLVTPSRNMVLP